MFVFTVGTADMHIFSCFKIFNGVNFFNRNLFFIALL